MYWVINFQIIFQEEFGGDGVDLYDDVIAAPPGGGDNNTSARSETGSNNDSSSGTNHTNNFHHSSNNVNNSIGAGRFRLYIGNLTWVSIDFECYAVLLS